jgi:thymidine kinase
MYYIEREVFAKRKVCLIRPMKDTRDYFSHSEGVESSYNKLNIQHYYFDKINIDIDYAIFEKYDSIFIDECFMIENAFEVAKRFSDSKNIFYAGLLASSECNIFPEVAKLLPYCEHIEKLNGVCMLCGNQTANYSFYKGKKVSDIVVGDNDYLLLCKTCYTKLSS